MSIVRLARLSSAFVLVVCAMLVPAGCGSSPKRAANTSQVPPSRGPEADAMIARADVLAARGNSEGAASLYREALSIAPDRYIAWNNLGVELMNLGNNIDAVAAFKVAADLSPRDPRPLANVGLVYQNIGWAQDALEYYERSLQRDPAFLDALRGWALAEEHLNYASLESLERIKRATLMESDPQWREFFERRRFRIQDQLNRSSE
ncbi:MAG: tetratricopeptide repeat protein [Phycisphaeraceae bacterium]|nr:tetratricopeptide repeat protein [Phycisphaeraceae bacterium]MCW5761872.1 tetratricopeptide repeat protein [Phycisphaeraceae bacterium]